MKYINKPVPKKDAMALVTGKPVYTDDIAPANCLIVKVLRSPHAFARITDIQTKTARQLPGVACVLTHEDVPQNRFTMAGQSFPEPSPYDRLILDPLVRYVGDPVAIVAARTEKQANAAMKKIQVSYDILEPVFDPEQALDHAIEQDQWNREFLQTQWEWGAQDRDRVLGENAIDREMFYGMLGQDRAYAQDAYQYNQAANEQDRAMFREALAAHQGSVDEANAHSRQEWEWNRGNIEQDRAYYDQHFKPLEQELIADARPTEGQYAMESAKAAADVAGAYDKQMGIQRREAARYGVNPQSGRYASANRALGLGRAAAEAGGMTQARENVRNRADANRGLGLQMGQTHRNTQILNPNKYANYGMASFKSSNANYNAPLATPSSYAGFGLPGQYQSGATGVAQNYAGAMGDAAQSQANANAQSQSGMFGAVGTGLGLAASAFLSTRRIKDNIRNFPVDRAMDLLRAVEVVSFDYKPGMGEPGRHIGAIAEDVPAVFATPSRGALSMYSIVGALMAAVQQLDRRLEQAESRGGCAGGACRKTH